jgi:hypothetical protein
MTVFPITLLTASILALLLIFLSYKCVECRLRQRIALGDGGNDEMKRLARIQGNFTEYVPIALILLAMVEANNASPILTYGMGTFLILGRVLHAWGLSIRAEASVGRFLGTLLTWMVIIAGSATGFYLSLNLGG